MLLRRDLLAGRRIVVAGEPPPLLAALGAEVHRLPADADAVAALARAEPPSTLVVDAAGPFGAGGHAGLLAALDETWDVVRGVATAAWVPAGPPGRIVLLAPRPGVGGHAEAARAGLENLARTLSIEWARFGVTTTALAPGPDASDEDVATLVAYLASPAGDYFSGARLDLGTGA
jgi:NAD(P)-dependent dehydrogenase (short-subunit alcohol dehydrogenase family)